MTAVYLLILLLLILMNAFFVLAEFAAVKVRGTQIEAMKSKGDWRVPMLQRVHDHIDEYLAVCQVGITFASIGLGFAGEPAFAHMLVPLMGHGAAAHAVAITVSYIVVSFMHIVLGEQVPKYVALRRIESSALFSAPALRFFHMLFYLPLKVLNWSANAILHLMRMPATTKDNAPSEVELRLMLNRSQQQGMMPFRRLLLMENVFDFGDGHVRDEMQPISKVVALYADHPWEENRDKILKTRFSRYPLLEGTPPKPLGVVHLKDLIYENVPWPNPVDLRAIARKAHLTSLDTSLEQLLTDLRRRRVHMALVKDQTGALVGLITMEDVIEQLVGAIEDEFELEAPLRLGDVLAESRVLMELHSKDAMNAIAEIINHVPPGELPAPASAIIEAVRARERSLPTFLGHELAVPHARLEGLKNAVVFAARSANGVKFGDEMNQVADFVFLLLTPVSAPRMQVKLLARIASLRESTYVWERILSSATPAEMLEAIRSSDEMLTE
jgi:CBS domain containing-hemolysin-like protein/mannitol/fructose-specific phosphotransferase system IIA component (Ntr-type)